jgi:hypothetical protein
MLRGKMKIVFQMWIALFAVISLAGPPSGLAYGAQAFTTTELQKAGQPAPVVCTRRLQLRYPGRCNGSAGRERLIDLAVEGLYPERPLPTMGLDSSLGEVPYFYRRSARSDGTPVYNSLENALEGKDPLWTIEPGFVFFSWIDRFERNGRAVYMTNPGIYIPGNGLARIVLPDFRGVAFQRTPERAFAWILVSGETQKEPGFGKPTSGRWRSRYEMVWVYDQVTLGDLDWYKIGPEEWIEQRLIAKVDPDPERPEGVGADRWIAVNLYEQTLAVYEEGHMIYATLVSSGLNGWWTQPGVFQIKTKLESDPMRGAFEADRSDFYYLEDVPWVMYYDQQRALHGAYWHNGFGYPRSHGCVNLSLADAQWLFNWAEEGTWVYVFDPTGETPTDDELYGPGGA